MRTPGKSTSLSLAPIAEGTHNADSMIESKVIYYLDLESK
jgi:hypothetical protein